MSIIEHRGYEVGKGNYGAERTAWNTGRGKRQRKGNEGEELMPKTFGKVIWKPSIV